MILAELGMRTKRAGRTASAKRSILLVSCWAMYLQHSPGHALSSLRFTSRWYLCTQKKPIPAPHHLSQVYPTLPLKWFQCLSEHHTLTQSKSTHTLTQSKSTNQSVNPSSVQGGIYACKKAQMCSTTSLRRLPEVAFERVPVFI